MAEHDGVFGRVGRGRVIVTDAQLPAVIRRRVAVRARARSRLDAWSRIVAQPESTKSAVIPTARTSIAREPKRMDGNPFPNDQPTQPRNFTEFCPGGFAAR